MLSGLVLHFRHTVLVIIGAFLCISVFVHGFREVAVYIISIDFPSALRIGKSNQLIFSVIFVLTFSYFVGFLLPTDLYLIGLSCIGKRSLLSVLSASAAPPVPSPSLLFLTTETTQKSPYSRLIIPRRYYSLTSIMLYHDPEKKNL